MKEYATHTTCVTTKQQYNRDLQNFMHFIYKGKANVSEEDLNNFHKIAEDFNVRKKYLFF